MAKFCTNCGKELDDGTAFCTECGAKAPEAPSVPRAEPQQSPVTAPPQYTQAPAYTQPAPAENAGKKGFVSTAYYFFMIVVFSIPLVGFIACLATAFSGDNKSKKNFSKAYLIWMILGVVFSIIGIISLISIGKSLLDYVNTQLGGDFGSIGDLFFQFNQVN